MLQLALDDLAKDRTAVNMCCASVSLAAVLFIFLTMLDSWRVLNELMLGPAQPTQHGYDTSDVSAYMYMKV